MRKSMQVLSLGTVVMLLASLLLCSCKNKEMAETIKPATTKIDGNLGEYFEVEDRDYKVDEYSSQIKIKVKRIKDDEEGFSRFGYGYEIYDEDGNVLDSKPADLEAINPTDSFDFLRAKVGENATFYMYIGGWPEALRGAKTFKLTLRSSE